MTQSGSPDDRRPGSGATEALLEIYRELDAEIARLGWTCRACATCCRFTDIGHELFVTSIEADYLAEGADLSGMISGDICFFLVDGRCSRRDRRTVCCRTYYCSQNGKGDMEALTERYIAKLKALHDRLGVPWCYDRISAHLNRRKSNASNKKR